MTLLEVRGLGVSYRSGGREVPAVRGVDLTLDRGETLGLAGESGSGKSTLALSLLRLLPAGTRVEGQVRWEGEDLLTAKWSRVRAVRWAGASVVFQGALSALNPVRTVGDQICEPIVLHEGATRREARRRAGELLESVGVPVRRLDGYPHEFSGGQRQRIMIAMALACRPDLIIADEPTTALDVMVQAQILQLLADLVKEERIAVLMISHDLSVLAQMCDRLAVMYAGQLVETGPSAQLLTDPRHPYTRALAGAFPVIGDPASRRAPSGLPGDPPNQAQLGAGCAFAPRCPEADADCRTGAVQLWPAGPGRDAACLRVLPDGVLPDGALRDGAAERPADGADAVPAEPGGADATGERAGEQAEEQAAPQPAAGTSAGGQS
ncbi:ABC transporter ATP-binding protein [Streptacidiphilus sp. ASG 303]|uniref:ABC transporter ATP-binding protein n=1 Tax=Streptacidiphilus sp. ASG 303 TaxID=2896847 RepID=UPI001E468D05|nr:ABC transporter ATP-binding protein [Streptacidiphilus sp. ASG 303]MCD0481056.1 ABC transporter ATP-binding protein [Streptacidiphilus sp. ASG 303]